MFSPLERVRCCVLLLLVLCAAPVYAQTPSYNLVDLGTLGGYTSYAYGINNAGQVVGYADLSTSPNGPEHATVWTVSGSTVNHTDLGTLGGSVSIAYAINNAGRIVGTSFLSGNGQRAALFTPASGGAYTVTDLGPYPNGTTAAHGIDDAGHIIGYATVSQGTYSNYYALLFNQNGIASGPPTYLGASGVTNSRACAISPAGLIVGDHTFTESTRTASRATSYGVAGSTVMRTDLGSFGDNNSFALAVSPAGQAAGYAFTGSGTTSHAVLFATPGSSAAFQDLGTLPGGTYAYVSGINRAGQVVGTGDGGANGMTGILYTAATGMLNLTNLVGTLPAGTAVIVQAQGNPINDFGQIAANANIGSNAAGVGPSNHAVLLNPTTPLSTVSGATQDTRLVAGASYASARAFTNPTTNSRNTTVGFLGGTAGSGGTGTYGLNRDVTTAFVANPAATPLASDAADVEGTATDTVVIQMTYAPGFADAYFGNGGNGCLGWFDGKKWVNAVDGNTGGTPVSAGNRAYNAATDFHLGTFGIDTTHAVVWAVVNHGGVLGVTLNPDVLKKVKSTTRSGTATTLALDSFAGHVYQLQRAGALTGSPGDFVDVEAAQNGATGTTLYFTHDDSSTPLGVYRIKLDP